MGECIDSLEELSSSDLFQRCYWGQTFTQEFLQAMEVEDTLLYEVELVYSRIYEHLIDIEYGMEYLDMPVHQHLIDADREDRINGDTRARDEVLKKSESREQTFFIQYLFELMDSWMYRNGGKVMG